MPHLTSRGTTVQRHGHGGERWYGTLLWRCRVNCETVLAMYALGLRIFQYFQFAPCPHAEYARPAGPQYSAWVPVEGRSRRLKVLAVVNATGRGPD